MATDRRPRPTRTDWQSVIPQVSDDWYKAYENHTKQDAPQEESGFVDKLWGSAKAVGEGLTFFPSGVVDTLQDAVLGFDPSDKEEMAQRAQRESELQAYQQKYAGQAWEGVTDATISAPYSLATMGAGLLGGVGGAFAGPVGAGAAGMAASGTMAYRASVPEFERTMYGVTTDALGREPSPEEWIRVRDNFAAEATKYGLWEAGPEAVSNLLMVKILGPLGSKFKGGVKDVIKRVAGLYGEELATETITQMGQGAIQADIGLRENAPGVVDAFNEVAPATFWQTTLMAGGKKGLDLAFRRTRWNGQTAEPDGPLVSEEGAKSVPQTEARDVGGVLALPPAKPAPFLPEGSEDLTDWLKETEANLDREFGPEVVAGQTVDLLDWTAAEVDAVSPYAALPVGGPSPKELPAAGLPGAFALPQGGGFMPPAVSTALPMSGTAPSGRTIAPPTDFSNPIPQPAGQGRLALPQQPMASVNPGLWSGGKSQLAYGPKPAPIPAAQQVLNMQPTPRADTTAQAQALGIPAPDPMPAASALGAGAPAPAMPDVPTVPPVPAMPSMPVPAPQVMPALPPQAAENVVTTAQLAAQSMPQQAPSAVPNTRSAMLGQVSPENKQLAKKLEKKPLARLVATEQVPEPFASIEWTREDSPSPTAEGGTVFTSGSGRKMTPFPVVDYTTPGKRKSSNTKAATWLLEEAKKEAAGNQSFMRHLNSLTPTNIPPATVNELAEVLTYGAPEEAPRILKPLSDPVQDTADTQPKPSEAQGQPERNTQPPAEQAAQEGYPKPTWGYGLPSFVTAQYGGKNSSAQEKQGESSSVPKAGVVKSTQQEEENRTTPKEKNHAPEQSTIGEGYNRGHEVEGTEPVQGAERERGAGSRSNAPSGSGGRGLRVGVVGRDERDNNSEAGEAGNTASGTSANADRSTEPDVERSSGTGVRVPDRGRTKRTERISQRDKLDEDGRLKKAGAQDYSAPEGSLTRTGSWKETALRNLDIIELAKKLTKEGRQATLEEQAQLARYTGFGASEIRNKLFPVDRDGNILSREIQPHRVAEDWRPLAERAKEMLSADEMGTLLQSTQYAHYTSESVIRSIWSGLQRLGFEGGSILEPGMGTGLFVVAGPKSLTDASQYTGIEMDKITAEIAGHILPASNVLNADFTKTKFPDNFFDLAIGNPPFAGIKILSDPAYRKHRFSLHDYFFAKSMDKVRPGGLLVFVTSRYTMDKQEDKARQYLAGRADLVGAIRLPQSAFMKNAGTEVVTDVLFLRKRLQGEQPGGEAWAGLQEMKTQEGEALINEYFVQHPEMVLGTNSLKGTMYSKNEYTVLPMEGDIETHFAKAVQNLPAGVYAKGAEAGSMLKAQTLERDFNPKHTKEGGVYLDDEGNLRRLENGSGVDLSTVRKLNDRERKWMHDYVGLRDALKQAQYDQLNDGEWEQSLAELNQKYANFVEKHGDIQHFTESVRIVKNEDGEQVERVQRRFRNKLLLELDIEGPLVQSLETITEKGDIELGPFLKGRTIKKPTAPEIKTTQDALMVSLDLRGVLDLDSVAELAGKNRDEVIEELGDSIYEAPDDSWKMADEYLSGDVVTKLEEAEAAARIKPRFDRNVQALIKVQPTPIEAKNINVDLGANWIPIEYINGFAKEVLQLGNPRISYNRDAGLYNVAGTGARRVAGESEWGTPARNPEDILEAVLNSRSITIRWTDAEKRTHVDNEATAAANEKADAIREAFQNWVWQDAERVSSLVALYNRTFNNMAPRRFDGTHLSLPGLSLRYKLYDHQKRAIWRIIQTGNTYLAHAVGAGKTLEMIVAGMEQRRLGLIQRPMYVVPNHMLDQFSKEFIDAYPLANIMVADEKHFDKNNRRRFIAQAAINDPDAIVITHSAFGRIGLKEETIKKTSEAFVKQLEAALEDVDKSERITRSRLEKRLEQAKQQMDKRISKSRDQGVFFEEMGVDFLFVDEAHEFRKLDFVTNRDNVKGINPAGSAMSMDLFAKLSWMHEQNPTRSHVLASGTPVTNTMAEMYTLMRYMDPESLERDGLETFDAWASMFGRVRKELEQNAAGKYEFVERFSKFVNVPELMKRVRSFMDVLTMDKLGQYVKRPDLKGGVPGNVVTPTSEAVRKYLDTELSERIKQSRNWRPSPGVRGNPDPMLRIISDGRLAALDLRFVQPDAADDPDSKLNLMVNDIIKTYEDTKGIVYTGAEGKPDAIPGGTQIVFSPVGFGDQVAQSRGFDLRADITRKLKAAGIKASEIAWMGDHKTTAKKGNLFADMRAGKVRVLFGSPKNMGTGVNVQKRLAKLHYLSPPWFPSDVEQPHGRILRQGNQNEEVSINWYATKGTYDSTMWGMVARKAKFIEQALNGDDSVRSIEDISESSTYEMASALAAGDERVIQLAGLNADVERLNRLKGAHANEQRRFRSEIHRLESLIKKREEDTFELEATRKVIEAEDPARFRLEVDGVTYDKQGEAGTAMHEALTTELNAWAPKTRDEYKTVTVGKLFGKFPVKLRLEVSLVEGEKKKVPAGMVVDYGNKNSDEVSYHVFNENLTASGLVGRMHRNANGYSAEIRDLQQRLEDDRRSLEKFRSRLGTPFPQEGELAEKVAEAGRLKAELAADGAKQTDVESTEIDGPIESVLFAAEDTPMASLSPGEFLPPRRKTRQRLRTAGVRRIADALSKRAKNAVPTRVVDTFNELPATLRRAFAGQADLVEGVYYDGTVWLVAENITDAGRVADVWAHEQVVHGGLRSLFGKEGKDRLLRKLWNAVDGMGNTGVAEIARRYGLNPRTDINARTLVMEEYLAALAEKRREAFTPEERTAWRRIVRAIADMWNRIVEAVSGRPSHMGMKEVEALLSALNQYVMDGVPSQDMAPLSGREALASLDAESERFFYDEGIFPSLRTDPDPEKTVKAYKLFRVRKDKPGKLFPLFVSADEAVDMGVWLDADIGAATPDGKVKSKLGGLAMRPGWHAGDAPVATHIGDKPGKADKAPSIRPENQVWAEIEAADDVDWQTEANRRTEHTKDGKPIARTAHITDQIPKDGLYRYKTNPNMTGTWIITGSMKVNRILSDAEVKRINKAKGIADLPRLNPFEAEKYGFDDLGQEDGDAPRASLRNVLRMGARDAMEFAEENPDIGKFFAKSEDLSMFSRIFNLPHWIAKQFPGFARIYNRQLKRMDERNADRVKSMQEISSLFGDHPISGPDMDALRDFIWEYDGKQIKELEDTPKFLDREMLASGRPLLDKNPEWDSAYTAWVNRQKLPDAAKKAMTEIRMSLDNDLMRTHNRMAQMAEFSTSDLQEFRSTINHVHNYFPHHRYGQYYVQARIGNEVVYREHFDALNGGQAKRRAMEMIKAKRAEYPGAKWSADKNERLPDEVYGVPLDTEAMEQVINTATARLEDREKAKEIRGVLHEAIADTLKARGWGSHAIGRKGIPGHETQDIVRVLYDYKSGLCGWTTKIEAARDFTQALAQIDARETPKLWTYASQYVQDMLRNYDNVDRVVGNIKAAAFAWYLGGNLKTAVLNLTQNVIVGVPRLQLEVDGAVMTFLKAAQTALVDQASGRKGKGLPDEEARLIQELYNDAVINDAFMEEVRGRMGDSGNKLLNKTMKALGWPMSVAERFNRASLALAAFRAARGGNLKDKTRLRLGIVGNIASYEQAKAFAESMVRDSHFVYGKANMPEFLRSGTAGRIGSAMYTFRTFSHNLLSLWHWAIKEHGLAGAGMVAKGLGATVAMGGLASFPFYATAMALFQAASGDDDDWTESVRKMLPESNLLRDMVCYGIPAMGGVNLGGSLKMETPLTQGLSKGGTPKEVLTDSIGDILGIPYDLFVVKPSKVMESMKYGNTWRAVEEVAPVAAKNIMQAWRLYLEGQTAQSGRSINDPGKQGPRKLSASESVGKALGFQPVSSTKSFDAYNAQKHRDTVRSEKIGDIATAMLVAREKNDVPGMVAARKEMKEWNEKMVREGKPAMRIKLEEVQRRMVARRREAKATPKNKEKGRAFAEVWGG